MGRGIGEPHCLHFARGEFAKMGTPQLGIQYDYRVNGSEEMEKKGGDKAIPLGTKHHITTM